MSIKQKLMEYKDISEKMKVLDTQKKKLADEIKSYSMENLERDTNGNHLAKEDNFTYGAQARKKVSINQGKAEVFFKSKKLWHKVVETQEVISESKIEELINQGEMEVEDLELITDVAVTYSIQVKEEKVVEEEVFEIKATKDSNGKEEVQATSKRKIFKKKV